MVPEDTMVGTNECNDECNSLCITESDYEAIKDGIILRMEDTIIYGDVIWTANFSTEYIYDGIWLDKSDVKYVGFTVGTSDGKIPRFTDNTMVGVADSSKLGK